MCQQSTAQSKEHRNSMKNVNIQTSSKAIQQIPRHSVTLIVKVDLGKKDENNFGKYDSESITKRGQKVEDYLEYISQTSSLQSESRVSGNQAAS